jgi:hypothetical protein
VKTIISLIVLSPVHREVCPYTPSFFMLMAIPGHHRPFQPAV